ncbi:DUF6069 family protein [Micromonospora endolithica]|uniref:DUF6069 family protein n=1 Tax=Micromonospora endolithica TaxID=230091 RepID=UPI0011AE156B|nr:DUF6069 family protein [Micromonospora endolithica]TWJ21867.1 hypothetical protein JD76_01981 [Micromonospora endolithica]
MTATAQPTTSSARRRALGVLAAVASCVLIWVIGSLAGVDWTVTSPGRPAMELGLAPVVVVSLGASLVGWAALAVLERFAGRRATLIWTVLAAVVALVSLFPLLGVEASTGAKFSLAAMHLAVAAVLIPILPTRR